MRDRASLFMLFIAPVVIIAVAGFSLANLFGAPAAQDGCMLPVVDHDHGKVATAIINALAGERSCKLVKASNLDAARRLVLGGARVPLALLIPPNTTAAFEAGQTSTIKVLVDPVKRLQASAIELRLNAVSQQLASAAQMQMRRQFADRMAELRAHLEEAGAHARALELSMRAYRRRFSKARNAAQQAVRAQIQRQLDTLEAASQASIAQATALTQQ